MKNIETLLSSRDVRFLDIFEKKKAAAFGFLLGSLAMPVFAAEGIARENLLGNEIILLDDQTWVFADETTSIENVKAALADPCVSNVVGDIRICPPENWELTSRYANDSGLESYYEDGNGSGFMLSLAYYDDYGHDGDFEYYAHTEQTGFFDRLIEAAIDRAMGMSFKEEKVIVEDAIWISSISNFGGQISAGIDLMFEGEIFYLDLYPDGDEFNYDLTGKEEELEELVKTLPSMVSFRGRDFEALLQNEREAK